MYVCMHACTCVYMDLFTCSICVCVCAYVYVSVHVHVHVHVYVYVYVYVYIIVYPDIYHSIYSIRGTISKVRIHQRELELYGTR